LGTGTEGIGPSGPKIFASASFPRRFVRLHTSFAEVPTWGGRHDSKPKQFQHPAIFA